MHLALPGATSCFHNMFLLPPLFLLLTIIFQSVHQPTIYVAKLPIRPENISPADCFSSLVKHPRLDAERKDLLAHSGTLQVSRCPYMKCKGRVITSPVSLYSGQTLLKVHQSTDGPAISETSHFALMVLLQR